MWLFVLPAGFCHILQLIWKFDQLCQHYVVEFYNYLINGFNYDVTQLTNRKMALNQTNNEMLVSLWSLQRTIISVRIYHNCQHKLWLKDMSTCKYSKCYYLHFLQTKLNYILKILKIWWWKLYLIYVDFWSIPHTIMKNYNLAVTLKLVIFLFSEILFYLWLIKVRINKTQIMQFV